MAPLSGTLVAAVSLAWLAFVFGAALFADRRPALLSRHWGWIYALSLAVYCTSWTFFGTVTQAARYQWPLPPTFVGTILLYALAGTGMIGLVRRAREVHASSLADFIAARLGRDPKLAAVVTLIAILGLIPYIALQLKAVAMAYGLLTHGINGGSNIGGSSIDIGLVIALVVAAFTMLFGTRRSDIGWHNRGLVFAVAMESLFKLAAMLALGLFVATHHGDIATHTAMPPPHDRQGFAPLVVLGVLAMFTLPHQFHVGVVECRQESHLRTARWLFPLYMLLISLPLLPLARMGHAEFANGLVSSDLYVLALPMAHGINGLALFAFLGGMAAATGMVVISLLTLSLMIGNHWLAPGLLRGAWARGAGDLRGRVVMLRRISIVLIVFLAWAYGRAVAGEVALADVGAVSFSALATLAPAMALAVWQPQTPPRAVIFGIIAGFMAWAWAMLVPLLGDAGWVSRSLVEEGPFGWHWLAPDHLLSLTSWGRLGRALGVSLLVSTAVTFAVSLWLPRQQRRELERFDAATLRNAGMRFLGPERIALLLADAPAKGAVPLEVSDAVERELAAVLGSASARLLLDTARRTSSAELHTVAMIVDRASRDLNFNQRVLQGALENMSQGISVVDADLRLVAWNTRYQELFGFPDGLLEVGMPVVTASRWALGWMKHPGDHEAALAKRLDHMRAGTPHLSERVFPNGSIIEIRGNPMPGGGFVATFTDVTTFRRTESELQDINATLEDRVDERTRLLDAARADAERANDAKTRFLTAVGHDLLQPLHAAQLFADALTQQLDDGEQRRVVGQIHDALDSTTDLLTGLFDMSRLEAGGLAPEPRTFQLLEVLDPLAAQFAALAQARGLRFRYRPTRAWVRSDPQLLRRILQNFLANAVRYTANGSVLLGVRHARSGMLRLEVHDTGPGIAADQQAVIFEEFRRGDGVPGQGLGLGLAIADRLSGLLDAPLGLHSRLGRGSVFTIGIARAKAAKTTQLTTAGRDARVTRILAVDNDPQSLDALVTVLRSWGYEVMTAMDLPSAIAAMESGGIDAWLFDYHLDDRLTGVALHDALAQRFGECPTLILSADDGGATRRDVLEHGLTLLRKPLRPLALKSVLDRVLAAAV
ncbi:hybrid sensor histidine kinase/response regulator [Solilutibacter silvestris]|uniref:histidine kinase n=1 Tax=Solilutibacter silvestris TaxID=1645665 RepID=A0A2K1PZ55_9GAMM|nr:PAS domain-containing hybrid sensor histidine kinase/response regulator [Lysobacter silvestris]PNS08060.1 PAS fold-containing protein [Lysobacter silvestris]